MGCSCEGFGEMCVDVKGGLRMYRKPAIAGRVVLALVMCIVLCFGSNAAMAQDYDTLRMQIGTASGFIGQLVTIPVYLATEIAETDSCGGFDISISLSRPDLMFFEVDTTTIDTVIEGDPPDTTYYDIDTMFVCQFDTVGALASSWDMVNCRSPLGRGLDLQLTGIADVGETGNNAIPADTSGILLNIFGRIKSDVPDTLSNRIVNIDAYTYYFSDRTGDNLLLPAKSINGWVEVQRAEPGDVNCDGTIDPLDVTYIINRVYKSWDVLCNDELGDIDCSGVLDPIDATILINYVFKSWPFPGC